MPVTEKAMAATTALTGRRAKAAIAARYPMMGRELVFMFILSLGLPREHGPSPKVAGNASGPGPARGRGPERRVEQGLRVVAVHPGDEVVGDQLGARRAALVLVRAAPEPEPVHRGHHREHAAVALAFLHAATHAPHPMHWAASMASSATSFGTGTELASGAEPVRAVMNPPACWIASNALRSVTRSLMTGNGRARNGSTTIRSPSLKLRMYVWHEATPWLGPCGLPLITSEHVPQIPSRQSCEKAIGSSPLAAISSFTTSSISRNDMSGFTRC